jgi:hypothetical protein
MKTYNVLFGIIIIILLIGFYIFSLTPNEKWLLYMKSNAERYGDALLSNDATIQEKYKNKFSDCIVASNKKEMTVLFSPQYNDKILVVYAPTHYDTELIYESVKAKKIAAKWYALNSNATESPK